MYSTYFDTGRWTAGPLQITLTAQLNVDLAVIFHAFSDPQMMCQLFPWMDSVVIESISTGQYGLGAVRTCVLDNGLLLEEEIIGWEPPHGYAYRGIDETHPFGMRGHVGVLSFKAASGGCQLTWQQYFSHANVPAMQAQLQISMEVALDRLAKRFGGRFETRPEHVI